MTGRERTQDGRKGAEVRKVNQPGLLWCLVVLLVCLHGVGGS